MPPEEVRPFELTQEPKGEFTLLRLGGRYVPALLEEMHRDFLCGPRRLAVDASTLSGTRFPLIRELRSFARRFESEGGGVVLVRTPDRLREAVRLMGVEAPTLATVEESDLEAGWPAVQERVRERAQVVEVVRRKLARKSVWTLADDNRFWLCPFCATFRRDVCIVSFRRAPPLTLDRIAEHLLRWCPNYKDHPRKPWPRKVLERLVRFEREQKKTAAEAASKALPEEIVQGLDVARERQRRLLPATAPNIPGGEIALLYAPVDRIGGDFYDFIPLSDGRLGLVIGDVAGHGIEAAVLMGVVKKVLQVRLMETEDPKAALTLANGDLLADLGRACFVTAFVGVLDPARRTFLSVRAGHNPPIICNAALEPRVSFIDPEGAALGLNAPSAYENLLVPREVILRPGDVMLLYTDGFSEEQDPAGEEFGVERLVRTISENAAQDANMILAALSVEVENFTRGRSTEDDRTGICVKIR